jgi:large subunit ribosomal protein L7e
MQVEKPKQQIKSNAPETHKKKHARNAKLADARKRFIQKRKEQTKTKAAEYAKRGEAHFKKFAAEQKELVALKRKARAEGSFYVPAESRVILIVRIRGINNLAPQVRKILQLLRLRQIHNATFVRVNRATLNMIKKIEPYVTFGYPTRHTISNMIYKRGYGKINKQRIPIDSNLVVEKGLRQHNIICVEDLINEIYNVGTNFKAANNFLWSFKLSSPKGGFSNKRHPYQKGGDWGMREEEINSLVANML